LPLPSSSSPYASPYRTEARAWASSAENCKVVCVVTSPPVRRLQEEMKQRKREEIERAVAEARAKHQAARPHPAQTRTGA